MFYNSPKNNLYPAERGHKSELFEWYQPQLLDVERCYWFACCRYSMFLVSILKREMELFFFNWNSEEIGLTWKPYFKTESLYYTCSHFKCYNSSQGQVLYFVPTLCQSWKSLLIIPDIEIQYHWGPVMSDWWNLPAMSVSPLWPQNLGNHWKHTYNNSSAWWFSIGEPCSLGSWSWPSESTAGLPVMIGFILKVHFFLYFQSICVVWHRATSHNATNILFDIFEDLQTVPVLYALLLRLGIPIIRLCYVSGEHR